MHPVIAKLQGDPDPTSAVREILQGVSMLADAAGVSIRYDIDGTNGAQPDAAKWHAGMGHIHAAIAMLGVRVASPFGDLIKQTKALPHQPING